jgi:hypothetical protein
MTRVVVDAQTWSKLSDPHELLELCDPSGQTLGYYQPAFRVGSVDGDKIHSPYTDEEIEQRRRQSGGETLVEFWKSLAPQ